MGKGIPILLKVMKRYIVFAEKLYNTDDVERNVPFYKWRLLHGVGKCDLYFIVLSPQNELWIVHGDHIDYELSDDKPLVIVGMSKTREGAVAVITSLVTLMAEGRTEFGYARLKGQVAV